MIRTTALLYCDGDGCADGTAQDPFDFHTKTAGEARELAKQNGWRRVRRGGRLVDLCPMCYENHPKDDEK